MWHTLSALPQTYRTAAIIDLGAYLHNLRHIRQHLPQGTLLMGVLKADGYGHGAVMLARTAGDLYDAYGAATIEEALELRTVDADKPILILGHVCADAYPDAIAHRIALAVSSVDMAQALDRVAQQMGTQALVHIAVDTGMSRIGFTDAHAAAALAQLAHVHICGMFTHYACADMPNLTMAHAQLAAFHAFHAQLHAQGVHVPLLHTANSAAITQVPTAALHMVRAGIVQYGLQPSADVHTLNLRPVLSWRACVSHVKTVPADTPVSYGATWVAPSARTIATVPVGYADGLPRALSNCGHVLVCGQRAPIVGRVCMDQFMVDVSEIAAQVQVGTPVTLVGTDGAAHITVDEQAQLAGSFNYEFVCGISKRVPRFYQQPLA